MRTNLQGTENWKQKLIIINMTSNKRIPQHSTAQLIRTHQFELIAMRGPSLIKIQYSMHKDSINNKYFLSVESAHNTVPISLSHYFTHTSTQSVVLRFIFSCLGGVVAIIVVYCLNEKK